MHSVEAQQDELEAPCTANRISARDSYALSEPVSLCGFPCGQWGHFLHTCFWCWVVFGKTNMDETGGI